MCLDTALLALVMLLAWEWHWLVVLTFWLVYTFISGAYLSSNVKKVPHGAWFSLMLAGILSIVSGVYHYGQSKKAQYVESHAVPLADLFEASPGGDDDKQFEAAWMTLQRHNSVQSTVTTTSDGAKSEEVSRVRGVVPFPAYSILCDPPDSLHPRAAAGGPRLGAPRAAAAAAGWDEAARGARSRSGFLLQ